MVSLGGDVHRQIDGHSSVFYSASGVRIHARRNRAPTSLSCASPPLHGLPRPMWAKEIPARRSLPHRPIYPLPTSSFQLFHLLVKRRDSARAGIAPRAVGWVPNGRTVRAQRGDSHAPRSMSSSAIAHMNEHEISGSVWRPAFNGKSRNFIRPPVSVSCRK